MTDREKIIETLRASGYGYFVTHEITNADEALANTADALIADGIGDVAAWKRRAEVAERALKIAATRLKCYGGLGEGFCTVSDCEYHHCSNDEGCVLAHLRKAERELAEEGKE